MISIKRQSCWRLLTVSNSHPLDADGHDVRTAQALAKPGLGRMAYVVTRWQDLQMQQTWWRKTRDTSALPYDPVECCTSVRALYNNSMFKPCLSEMHCNDDFFSFPAV